MFSKSLKLSTTLGFLVWGFSTSSTVAYDCSDKYCKEMVSCDEAYYKLKMCGMDKLDRDGDGIPCENVCGKGGKKASNKTTPKKATSNKIKGKSKKKK